MRPKFGKCLSDHFDCSERSECDKTKYPGVVKKNWGETKRGEVIILRGKYLSDRNIF